MPFVSHPVFARSALAVAVVVSLACTATQAQQAPRTSQADIIKQSAASDWRRLDPENTLVMEIHGKPVIMELAARFAPLHVANIRALTRSGYYTGSGVVRVQDNYVTQWADPHDEDKAKAKPLGTALAKLPAEFSIPLKDLPLTRFQDADGWAPVSGFVDGLPVAADPAQNQAWIAHCYGVVGAARGNQPDSSNGTSLYAIIGQAPRALDLNITVVGRVVQGMDVLSSLPRGPGTMGFYEKPEQAIPITRARLLADMPPRERPAIEVMRTDTPTWAALVEASRHAVGPWAVRSALHSNICNRSVPTRATAAPET
ncbi:MAG: peptidylprolyl isomerase [Rhodoferax sp.]|nr:peptidylprolyl isomerase [Rhodoferax sp.]